MNRIDAVFSDLKRRWRRAFVAYLTAGDPNAAQSEADVRAALDSGVDVLELGVPFSDPTADGPIIQAASQRALEAGGGLRPTLELVKRLRADYDTPIVLFGYANPFFKAGFDALCRRAADVGADGILCVDIPFEESEPLDNACRRAGLHLIRLIAPTTTKERAKRALADAGGFVYYIMVRGVTGERGAVDDGMTAPPAWLKECTALPVVAGFGVSNGAQAREVARHADGVVVGSALVRAARERRLREVACEIARATHGE